MTQRVGEIAEGPRVLVHRQPGGELVATARLAGGRVFRVAGVGRQRVLRELHRMLIWEARPSGI